MQSIWNTTQQIAGLLCNHSHEDQGRILEALTILRGSQNQPQVLRMAKTERDELTVQEAAKELGRHQSTIDHHIKKGTLPAVKRKGVRMIPRAALSNYRRRA